VALVDASGVEYPEYAQSLVMGLTGNITDVDLQKRRLDDVCGTSLRQMPVWVLEAMWLLGEEHGTDHQGTLE
jgi:hypothetical protein